MSSRWIAKLCSNPRQSWFETAGVSPYRTLLGATRTAAEHLGQSADIGTVKIGMEADLLLLRANPLQDIGATRGIRAVIYNGRVL